jgi:DNA mismatch repair protein MutL
MTITAARIRPLSASVINQIAAGEVLERPASAVKELLENGLDAQATHITVEVLAGGTELIRVVDNGSGIHPDDLLLAVTSHATSKLQSADDLFTIQSFGFRGEALASMAEVSRCLIRSRIADELHGRELEVRHGVLGDIRECGCPVGTTIELRDLFGNQPVRRKFLKSLATEFGQISEQFTRVAVAHPQVHLVLRHNERQVYQLPPVSQPRDRIAELFGPDITDHLIPVESQHAGIRVWGYVGHPSVSKSTRKHQYLFLNGRYIQDRTLQYALTEAYRGLLMVGRQPISFLFLELPCDQFDVNVHPTKAEVRFRDVQQLFRQLLSAVRTKFLSMNLQSSLQVTAEPNDGPSATLPRAPAVIGSRPELEFTQWVQQELATWTPSRPPTFGDDPSDASRGPMPADGSPESPGPTESSQPSESQRSSVPLESTEHPAVAASTAATGIVGSVRLDRAAVEPLETPDSISRSDVDLTTEPALGARSDDRPPAADASAMATIHSAARTVSAPHSSPPPPMALTPRALQIHDCYLVVETSEGMQVIDQHALHERILYEQLRNRVLTQSVESQHLLLPLPIELRPVEAAALLDQQSVLEQLGFGISEFGQGTVLLQRHPVLLRRVDLTQLVKDLAEQLSTDDRTPTRRDLLDELLHTMACKAAVKAGQRLTSDEIDALLQQLHLVDDAHHCPHGRPTVLNLSRAELDRQFGRLGS